LSLTTRFSKQLRSNFDLVLAAVLILGCRNSMERIA